MKGVDKHFRLELAFDEGVDKHFGLELAFDEGVDKHFGLELKNYGMNDMTVSLVVCTV